MKNKIKHITLLLFTVPLLFCQAACGRGEAPVKNEKPQAPLYTPEELLSQMTLAEKIGQMTQAERGDVQKGDIAKYGLGSILSGGGSTPASNTPDAWVAMINGFTEESLQSRLGIPVIYGLDAVHGHSNAMNAVVFPHNVGLGAIAAGDPGLGAESAYRAGFITAKEMLATGARWTFAPVLGVAEDVRWGRTYESYSENVEIVAIMGPSAVKGLQDGGVAACMKHFLGEGQTLGGQNQGNALLDRAGIERILPPYREAIAAGAMTLMPSFSSINGIKMHENRELLTGLLKEEMGFDGMVISDWSAVTQLSGGSYKAQIGKMINAGVDMNMATNGRGSWMSYIRYLTELVEEGVVPMERIDDAVLRILRFKQRLGLFDAPLTEKAGAIGTDERRAAARAMVSDSLVLLRNENNVIARLPEYKRILVAGQGADDIGMQCGGWTITWQGAHGPITKGTTILEGIRAAVKGGAEVAYAEDGKVNGEYDVIIAVIGEDPYAETQGDRANDSQDYSLAWTMDRETAKDMGAGPGGINIRARDMDMLWEVYDNGCPVIVIMLSGRPMTIGDEFENWDAFVAAWLPGSEGGGGIADVLFGDHDFTGRTPYTWRKTVNGEVLYPFGYGLSNARQDAGDFDYAVNNGAVTVTGYRGKGKDIAIPEKIGGLPVTAVGDGAFSRQKLTSVTIPGSVTAIGDRSFSYNRLSSLVLPDSVATVGYMAFSNNRLASLTLPDELVSIGMNAFSANRLKNLSLPGALDYIGDGAFTKNLLDSVSVPKTIWNFNSYAFDSYVKITRN